MRGIILDRSFANSLAITRRVQDAVNVIKDVVLGDGESSLIVVAWKARQCCVRDVVNTLRCFVKTLKCTSLSYLMYPQDSDTATVGSIDR